MRTKASLALLVIGLQLSGCYLGHLAVGQGRLLRARRPVEIVLADRATPPALRESLALAAEARDFARRLGLAVGEQYTSYVEWPGDRVVTTIVATRPGEVEPIGFWFPIAGRVPYKGYFDRERAEAEAERLRSKGRDVCVSAVPAYSTLGWLDDPLTGPMVRRAPGVLAETVVHELVHATVYVPGAPDWNEGLASFVGEEASIRLFAETGRGAETRRAQVTDGRLLDAALLRHRQAVAALYAHLPAGAERDAERLALGRSAREILAALPLETRDPAPLARGLPLNDACLALTGTYASHVPRFERRLETLGGDLAAFVAEAVAAGENGDPLAAFPDPGVP